MRKLFTLLAIAMMAVGVKAETLIDFAQSQTIGITVSGSTELSTVKIKTNTTSIPGIKFSNSYMKDDAVNNNYVELTAEGGFKTGDVVTIAGAFNNDDNSKIAKVDVFTYDGTTATVLFTTQQFINGRKVNDDPVVESYTLTADVEKLYLGRNGNTATFITTLKVVRGGEETAIVEVVEPTLDEGELIAYPKLMTGITISGTTAEGTLKIHSNTETVKGIILSSSYTTKNAEDVYELNDNYILLETEGGFKAGDVVTIAGAVNTNDASKVATADLFYSPDGKATTSIHLFDNFINGYSSDEDIVPQTYTLEADYDKLYLGRKGGTKACLTIINVKRGEGAGINVVNGEGFTVNGSVYDLSGRKVSNHYKGVVVKDGKKQILGR